VLEANRDQFSTLITILEALGVDEGLTQLPVTFFAPTNDAFTAAGIDPADLDLTDPAVVATVQGLLAYHVVEIPAGDSGFPVGGVFAVGAPPANAVTEVVVLADGQLLPTLQGGLIAVSGSGADVRLNETTAIVASLSNLVASNGMVQGIDRVLSPVAPASGG
jgi:transforming growth factor-beta-induced protein